jgi:signal transduction histidine kinase
LQTSKVPLHDPKGSVVGVLGVIEDISEKVRPYEEFLRFVSHSLKSRIAVLEANIVGLKLLVPDSAEVRRLENAVSLLKQAVLRAGKYALLGRLARPEQISVNSILTTVRSVRPDARFLVNLLEDDLVILGHRGELENAVFELIANACSFAPPIEKGGKVQIWGERQGHYCSIHVADNGPGVERSVDGPSAFVWPRRPGGAGIGLALVNYVLERHGGKLKEVSHLGSGAHFVLEFPVHRHKEGES